MSLSDLFILLIRWLHALAAVVWIGGGLFYILALRPALKNPVLGDPVNRIVGQEFKNIVETAIWVLIVTGAILFLNRVTFQYASSAYGIVLAIKITLAVWMFYLVRFRQRRTAISAAESNEPAGHTLLRKMKSVLSATNLILILGVIVLLLSEILRDLFEREILRG